MKNKLAAILVAVTLGMGGALMASPAFADEAPPPIDPTTTTVVETPPTEPTIEVVPDADVPDPAPTEDTTTIITDDSTTQTPEALVADDPTEKQAVVDTVKQDYGYGLALWKADDDGGDPLWPQTLVTYITQAESDLNALDAQATCGTYQADLYRDDDTTATLIAGGHLYGPSNPTESWPGDQGFQSSFAKQWTVTEGCIPPAPDPIFTHHKDSTYECYSEGGGLTTWTKTFYESDPTWDSETKAYVYGEPYVIDTKTWTKPIEPGIICPSPVTPPNPTFTDQCGPGFTLVIQGTQKMEGDLPYWDTADGIFIKHDNTSNGAGTIMIEFVASADKYIADSDGYTIAEGNAHWTFTATNTACPIPTTVTESLAMTGQSPTGVIGFAAALLLMGSAMTVIRLRRKVANEG